jgi:UDP-N-acetylmuramyl pentapeptide phosphotransferase/UDP-N-acetylglucosamine-1-phosphate transferase
MMTDTLIVAATLLLSAGLTRYLSSPRSAVNIMDHPNERSLHDTAIPRTGGLAIIISLAIGLAACLAMARAGWIGGRFAQGAVEAMSPDFQAVFLATLFLAVVSLFDDIKHVSPVLRLAGQVAAAAGLVWGADFTIASFWVPGYGPLPLGDSAYPITLLFIVWMANLYNFMDGLDGLAGGMAVFGFGVMGFLALVNGGAGIGLVAVLVAAAAAGFLVFNYPPARIFMGDVGAVPLGFLVASLAVKANRELVLGLWVPLILFSPFIVDATVVLLRRALRGARIWEAHREHYYQRLVLAGWSHTKTLWVEYAVMAGCAGVAVIYKQGVEGGRPVVTALVAVAYVTLALGVRAVERQAARRAAAAPRLRMVR